MVDSLRRKLVCGGDWEIMYWYVGDVLSFNDTIRVRREVSHVGYDEPVLEIRMFIGRSLVEDVLRCAL